MRVLGIHVGHDAGAALVVDGKVVVAVDEERLTRKKHNGDFPREAIRQCLEEAGGPIDRIAVSDDLLASGVYNGLELTPGRCLDATYLGRSKHTLFNWARTAKRLRQGAAKLPRYLRVSDALGRAPLYSIGHHLCHAASTWYTSGFDEDTLVVTMDGLGDNDSFCVWKPQAGRLELLYSAGRDGSIGFFYSLVTEALGWWIGDGEGKTMGLAPYGDPTKVPRDLLTPFLPRYRDGELAQPVDFGAVGTTQYGTSYHWHFDGADALAEQVAVYGAENVAALAQELLEEEVLAIIRAWKARTGLKKLATAGGIFLNVKLNQKIVEEELFEQMFVFPSAGDSGLSAGAALMAYFDDHAYRPGNGIRDVYWGPQYSDEHIRELLVHRHIAFEELDDPCETAAEVLAEGRILGWFQGRMEHGPRALGARSILMSPTKAENKDIINAHVKYREAFRPFCPSLKAEAAERYFTRTRPERYMITAYTVREERAGDIPAVVHVDATARPQIVEKDVYPRFWAVLDGFERRTGVPVLLNTSFNIKGEPIVCDPRDALKCFYDTGLEVLIMGKFLIRK
jgi:carbamoyltransferase